MLPINQTLQTCTQQLTTCTQQINNPASKKSMIAADKKGWG